MVGGVVMIVLVIVYTYDDTSPTVTKSTFVIHLVEGWREFEDVFHTQLVPYSSRERAL